MNFCFQFENIFFLLFFTKIPNKLKLMRESFKLITMKDIHSLDHWKYVWRILNSFLSILIKSGSRAELMDFFEENISILLDFSMVDLSGNETERIGGIYR